MLSFLLEIMGTSLELVLGGIAPIFVLTGELVLGILSLGYHRPQFNKQALKQEMPIKRLTFWVGIMFWVAIAIFWKFHYS